MINGILLPGMSVDDFKILLNDAVNCAVQDSLKLVYSNQNQKDILTRNETSGILGVTLATLNAWEKAGVLLPVRIGTRVRYRYDDVMKALTSKQLKKAA